MKTLLIALEFPPSIGGVETYYGKVAKYWPEKLLVLTNEKKALLSPFLPIFAWLRGLKSVKALIEREKPERVLVGEILPLGTIAYILSFLKVFKYGVFLHGLDFSLATRHIHKRWLSGLILKRATLVICANGITEAAVKKIFPAVKTAVVNPGVETNIPEVSASQQTQLRAEYKLENAYVLLTVGRLVERKGMDMVIQSLPTLIKKIPNCYYVMIGDGPYKEKLLALAKNIGVEQRVMIFSGLDDETKNDWLATSDIFIMPARMIDDDYEGFGIVYLEAGLFKKAVIAGEGGGVREAVEDNKTGLVINGRDQEEIAEAVLRLYHNETLRTNLGMAGHEKALAMAWPQQVQKIYSLLQNT